MHPFGQMEKFCEQLRGLKDEHLQKLFGGYLVDLRDAVMSGKLPDREAFHEFLGLGKLHPDLMELPGIVIPEGATIASLKAAGEYDNQSVDAKKYITGKYFKVTVTGDRRLSLIHFGKHMENRHVEEVVEKMGYVAALAEDLLAVGSHPEYRKLQLQFPIVALGSFVPMKGLREVPCLGRYGSGRGLRLVWGGGEWGRLCRFLIVRKEVALAA